MVWGLLVGAVLAAGPAPKAQAAAAAAAPKTQTAAAPAAAPKPQAAPAAEAKPKQTRIAVLDVQLTGGGDRKTVEGLSALLASEVARRPALTVVAGSDLRALVGFERQKQLLGCTEGSCLTEIAGALGVSYLVSTEASKVGSTWLLSLALLDAGKAVALKRLTRRAASDDALVDEAVRAVDELLTALPGAGLPGPASAPIAPVAAAPAGPLYAPGAPPPGFHEHDGFYFNVHAGGGILRTDGGGITLSGPAGSVSLALGACPVRNLAIFATMYVDVDTSPNYKDPTINISSSNITHRLNFWGLGATWYFTQSGWFLSAAGGGAQVSVDIDVNGTLTKLASKWGPAGRLTLGKEWWVSSDWGIGAAVHVSGASTKDSGDTATAATLGSNSVLLTLSATYN